MAEYRFLVEPDTLFETMPYGYDNHTHGTSAMMFALAQLRRGVEVYRLENYNYGYMYKNRKEFLKEVKAYINFYKKKFAKKEVKQNLTFVQTGTNPLATFDRLAAEDLAYAYMRHQGDSKYV